MTYQIVTIIIIPGQQSWIIQLISLRCAPQILIALLRQMLLHIHCDAAVPLPELQSKHILGAKCIRVRLSSQSAIVLHYQIAQLERRG